MHNVRDLGGYRTRSGGVARWGRFPRANTMHRLT
ncbi:MAG: tyrosine-protein phosphatase [Candidatus Latescibacterota bacterium]|nr:tyrosine-protein phosphatase [Candidatus Latescibacterota bacterium]